MKDELCWGNYNTRKEWGRGTAVTECIGRLLSLSQKPADYG